MRGEERSEKRKGGGKQRKYGNGKEIKGEKGKERKGKERKGKERKEVRKGN